MRVVYRIGLTLSQHMRLFFSKLGDKDDGNFSDLLLKTIKLISVFSLYPHFLKG
jgi:hypothetical protein